MKKKLLIFGFILTHIILLVGGFFLFPGSYHDPFFILPYFWLIKLDFIIFILIFIINYFGKKFKYLIILVVVNIIFILYCIYNFWFLQYLEKKYIESLSNPVFIGYEYISNEEDKKIGLKIKYKFNYKLDTKKEIPDISGNYLDIGDTYCLYFKEQDIYCPNKKYISDSGKDIVTYEVFPKVIGKNKNNLFCKKYDDISNIENDFDGSVSLHYTNYSENGYSPYYIKNSENNISTSISYKELNNLPLCK